MKARFKYVRFARGMRTGNGDGIFYRTASPLPGPRGGWPGVIQGGGGVFTVVLLHGSNPVAQVRRPKLLRDSALAERLMREAVVSGEAWGRFAVRERLEDEPGVTT